MKREISNNYLYLVLTPMEYLHIKTVLDNLIEDAFKNTDDLTYCDLEYVRYAIMEAYSSFIDMKDANKEGAKDLKDQGWISCSECLPARDVNVLTYHRNASFDYQYVSWIDEYTGNWAGFIGNLSDDVLAWMPLPEDYKEGGEEDENEQ